MSVKENRLKGTIFFRNIDNEFKSNKTIAMHIKFLTSARERIISER